MEIKNIVYNTWEEEREERMDQAAYELSDEIWEIKDKLEKANLLIVDVLSDFFDAYDPKKEEDINYIKHAFNRFRILTDMSHNLLHEAFQEIKVLKKRSSKITQAQLALEKGLNNGEV